MFAERQLDQARIDIQKQILTSPVYQSTLLTTSQHYLSDHHDDRHEYDLSLDVPLLFEHTEQCVSPEDQTEKHVQMSLSDIELALDYSEGKVKTPSSRETQAALMGIAGHHVSTITNSIIRSVLSDQPISISGSNHNINSYEAALMARVAETHVERYRSIRLIDVPSLAGDIWRGLRACYMFYKRNGSSKRALLEGSVFHADQVEQWWHSAKQLHFEDQVLSVYQKRVEESLFYSNTIPGLLSLPIESTIDADLQIEKPVINHINWGVFKIQARGQVDYLLRGKGENEAQYVVVDNKYGSSDVLSKAGRAQALLYSVLARNPDFAKLNFQEISPANVMFLYHVFDTSGPSPYSYYVDGTIYPHEYEEAMRTLTQAVTNWWFYQKDLKRIKKARNEAAVMPHLPKERDMNVATQRRLI